MIDEFPVVHVWSPYAFHESSYIVGNREGLIKLYNAVGTALNRDQESSVVTTNAFISDGEGYELTVMLVDDKNLDKLAIPYRADYAEEHREHATYPWDEQ